ncbi:MAG: flagellar biosynthetic protein FliO [Gammaproteobacteria bacterium]|nr:flagellar biosynthetic protein FliO [Gammaproteobacteria bacterium]MCF6363306.1 flagellar biosynthetic protein FliO [Gammaproteobacteria bacterium]
MENFTSGILTTLLALAIVISLVWITLRALKRIHYGKSTGDELRFVRALPVGSRERIVIIQYRNEEYLLGVTSGGISLLEKRPTTPTPPES